MIAANVLFTVVGCSTPAPEVEDVIFIYRAKATDGRPAQEGVLFTFGHPRYESYRQTPDPDYGDTPPAHEHYQPAFVYGDEVQHIPVDIEDWGPTLVEQLAALGYFERAAPVGSLDEGRQALYNRISWASDCLVLDIDGNVSVLTAPNPARFPNTPEGQQQRKEELDLYNLCIKTWHWTYNEVAPSQVLVEGGEILLSEVERQNRLAERDREEAEAWAAARRGEQTDAD